MRTLVIDVETRGLRPELGETTFACASCWLDSPTRVRVHRFPGDEPAVIDELTQAEAVLNHNVQFDARQLVRSLGLPIDFFNGKVLIDTLTRARHLWPKLRWAKRPKGEKSAYGLKALTAKASSVPGDAAAVRKWLRDRAKALYGRCTKLPPEQARELHDYSLLPPELLTTYLVGDIVRTVMLWRMLEPCFQAAPEGTRQTILLDERLINSLLVAEMRGLPISGPQLARQKAAMIQQRDELRAALPFTPAGHALRDQFAEHAVRLKCYSKKTDKQTGLFKLTFDAHAMQKMAADGVPYAQQVLDWRFYSKRISSYLEAWEQWLPVGRIHCGIHACGPHTGRMASSNPNLQTMPKDKGGSALKQIIVPEPGCVLIEADYRAFEYFGFAYLSGDKVLLDDLIHGDPHAKTARALFALSPTSDVTKLQRDCGKRFNFAMLFGATEHKLRRGMEELTQRPWSLTEIKAQSLAFRQRYAAAVAWSALVIDQADKGVPREDPLGRRHQPLFRRPYAMVNQLTQGFCAGIFKRGWLAAAAAGLDLRMPIHDAIIVSCADSPEAVRDTVSRLQSALCDVAGYHFDLEVKICRQSLGDPHSLEEYLALSSGSPASPPSPAPAS